MQKREMKLSTHSYISPYFLFKALWMLFIICFFQRSCSALCVPLKMSCELQFRSNSIEKIVKRVLRGLRCKYSDVCYSALLPTITFSWHSFMFCISFGSAVPCSLFLFVLLQVLPCSFLYVWRDQHNAKHSSHFYKKRGWRFNPMLILDHIHSIYPSVILFLL